MKDYSEQPVLSWLAYLERSREVIAKERPKERLKQSVVV